MNEPRFMEMDDVDACHRAALSIESSEERPLDIGLLESACHAAKQFFFYGECPEEPLEAIAVLAAYYWVRLSLNHGYADANKRTAFLCCSTFIARNGYRLILTNEEAIALSSLIVNEDRTQRLDEREVAEAIALRMVPF